MHQTNGVKKSIDQATLELKNGLSMDQLEEFNNSLTDLAFSFQDTNPYQITKTDTLNRNLDRDLISYKRELLSISYAKLGLVQTFIDQPVDDALGKGINILSEEIDEDDIKKIQNYIDENNILEIVGQCVKWGRLFGGAAIITLTDQNPKIHININRINENSRLSFKVVDRWDLWPTDSYKFVNRPNDFDLTDFPLNNEFFHYRGLQIHRSRLLLYIGKEAPYLIKQRLAGWGLSALESILISINKYYKYQDVIFELIDEAKIDVYKMQGYKSKLMQPSGTSEINKTITTTNMLKNNLNSLVMDTTDEYEQKQIAFGGLSDIASENRISVASEVKMPLTKIFGMSSSGFNSGEDDLENYNSTIEHTIRAKIKYQIIGIVKIVSQKVIGYIPEDLNIEFPALRIMSSEQEENIKDRQYSRLITSLEHSMISEEQFNEAVNKNNLLPIKI